MQTTVGEFLRQQRKSRKLTLEQTARVAGISRVTLNRWETGTNQPRLTELEAVLKALEADTRQRCKALALLDAPRGKMLVREEVNRIAEQVNLGPMPHGGNVLRAMRRRRGLSLEAVAAQMGVTEWTIRRWEKAEVWPSVEHLHALCFALGAQEEEVVALTCGCFAQGVTLEAETSIDALRQRLRETRTGRFPLMQNHLLDLAMLTLEAQIWPLAIRTAAGRRLLAELYTTYAGCLYDQEIHAEVGAYANRALDLLSENWSPDKLWLTASIHAAQAACRRDEGLVPRRGLKRFQALLPMAQGPNMQCWVMGWIGELLVEEGQMESGFAMLDRMCEVATRADNPMTLRLREADKANMLLKFGRPAQALPFLKTTPNDDPFFRTGLTLYQAEALLGVGHSSEAHDVLSQAYVGIESHDIAHLRPRAEVLAQRL